MVHYRKIYNRHADIYDRLISAEDTDKHLLPAMEQILDFKDKLVLDLGTGTGRIPQLLRNKVNQIFGLDLHLGMLQEQSYKIESSGGNCQLVQADLLQLPFPNHYFEIVTAGWAIGHFQSWFTGSWPAQVDKAIQEMIRVTRPNGTLLIIETLGTGSLKPEPPSIGLNNYYHYLEKNWGFIRTTISTDYQFQNLEEAIELAGFFFGEQMAFKIQENNWVRLHEWTGIWHKHKS